MFRWGALRSYVLFRRGEPVVPTGEPIVALLFHEYSLLIYVIGPFLRYFRKIYCLFYHQLSYDLYRVDKPSQLGCSIQIHVLQYSNQSTYSLICNLPSYNPTPSTY